MTLLYHFEGDDFEFEVNRSDYRGFLQKTLTRDDLIERIQSEFDENDDSVDNYDWDSYTFEELLDWAEDMYDNDEYEEELLEYFRDEAEEMYADMCEYREDPYRYNGVSRRDFM